MRTILPMGLAAAALFAATPALAQNQADPANTTEAAATNAEMTDANAVVPLDANAVDANAVATVPVDENLTAVDTTAPAPEKPRGFPWGVLGLVGLVGLLGRARR